MAQRRARAPWYVSSSTLASLKASFTCDTTELPDDTNSVTFNVALSNGTPYSGTVYFTYSSGLSGVASATCTDGSVTIDVTCSSPDDQTITISVEASGRVLAGSQTFSFTVVPLTLSFACDTTEFSDDTNSVTFTVTRSDGAPYSGTVNFAYSSGLSGVTSATCTNGSVTLSVTCSSTADQTITISVDASGRLLAGSQTFSFTVVPVTVSFTCDTTELFYGENSVTFNVTRSDGLPYSGTVNFAYSSGLSGDDSATCTDGSVTISATSSSTSDQTITISVDASGRLVAGSQTFSFTAVLLAASFTCDTSEILYGDNSVTFNVMLNSGSPYSGTVYFTYSSGLSGDESATCTDGSVTIDVTNASFDDQTITISVEAAEGLEAGSQSFTFEVSGISGTAWEFDTIDNCTTVGVPISTANAYTGMMIDWGDGTYTSVTSVSSYVHTYSTAGQYHIAVYYDDWESVTLSYSSSSSASSPISYARTNIAKVYAIPKVANTDFQYLFYRYTALTEVADDLFRYNTQITSFLCTFYYCTGLASLPDNLFRYNTAATVFDGAFWYCTSLSSLPADLLRYNTRATSFSTMFRDCTGITEIPADLFYYNTAVTGFNYTFLGCTSITEIPSGLFDNNTRVTMFSDTFSGCTALTSVPEGLFDNHTAVTTFHSLFSGCSRLASIPTNLFRYNTAVTVFKQAFLQASSLASQTVYIGSTSVTDVWRFGYLSGSSNSVYVPSGSTTYSSFSNGYQVGFTVRTYSA